ncbi:MAG: hypothetical protein ACK4QL_08385 [Pseudanabaenaceae cyanobacterium]
MTANEDQALEALKARRREKRWRIHLSYSFVLLILMIGLGTAAGIVGYEFGREALRGVKPSPPSVKLPTIAPEAPPPPTPPPTKGLNPSGASRIKPTSSMNSIIKPV